VEQRGTTLAPLADLDDLRPVAGAGGGVLSAYLALRPVSEQMDRETAARWQAARDRLAADGAPEAALAAVDAAVPDAYRRGAGLAVIAPGDGDGATVVEHLPGVPPDLATWGPAPSLRPLVAARQGTPPHVLALVDRTGADIVEWRRGAPPDGGRTRTVEGEDDVIRKVNAGGWSQRRFQQRAEDSWEHNAAGVAAEVAAAVERTGACVVALGGDERAVGLVRKALPAAVEPLVRAVALTRAPDGSEATLDAQVAAVLDTWAEEQLRTGLELLAEELGQGDRGVTGAAGTLAALRESRVATLLVPVTGDAGTAWRGETADQVATNRRELTAPDDAVEVPLLDAAVAAALATGADVHVLPVDPDRPDLAVPDDLAALLRW
jgi:hypothetical protein